MISGVVSRLAILTFGTLYPAYASFKAVRAKNVTEYVKWMMYWIVFAIFSSIETFTDIFLPWLPFYYEIKVVLVLWLLSPATNGSSILYRKFVHPLLKRKEPEIDGYIVRMRERGCATAMQLSTRVFNYVRTFVMDALHNSFTSNILTMHGNMVRPTASEANLNERHYDEWVPRSQSLQTIRKPTITITEESDGEELDVAQESTENEETATISGNRPKTNTIKGRRPQASNKNVVFLRRGRARKAKEASCHLVTDEDE